MTLRLHHETGPFVPTFTGMYRWRDDAVDFSFNGNDGTLINSPTFVPGPKGSAIKFNGTDQYVQIPGSGGYPLFDRTDLAKQGLTISTWFRTGSTTSFGTFYSEGNSGSANQFLRLDQSGPSSPYSKLLVNLYDNTGTSRLFMYSNSSPMDGNWHHMAVVITHDDKKVRLYIDGKLDSEDTYAGTTFTFNQAAWGARRRNTVDRYWNGYLAESCTFNQALTEKEVLHLYLSAPKAYWAWTMSELTGSTIKSGTDNANDGTLTNGPTWVDGPFKGTKALEFASASSQYVNMASNLAAILGGTASLSFWVKTTQVGNDINWQAPGITGVEQAGGSNDVFWGIIDASGYMGVARSDTWIKSSAPINDGQWHHVVLTADATTGQVKVYVDGVLQTVGTSGTGTKSTTFYSVGRVEDTGGTPVYFNGAIWRPIVVDRVLRDDEVERLYAPGVIR